MGVGGNANYAPTGAAEGESLLRHRIKVNSLLGVLMTFHYPHHLLGLQRLHRPGLYFFVLGAIVFEVIWFSFVQRRRYPWGEMLSSVGIYLLRIPFVLLRGLLVVPARPIR